MPNDVIAATVFVSSQNAGPPESPKHVPLPPVPFPRLFVNLKLKPFVYALSLPVSVVSPL